MINTKKLAALFAFTALSGSTLLPAVEVTVAESGGTTLFFDVSPNDTIESMLTEAAAYLGEEKQNAGWRINLCSGYAEEELFCKFVDRRDYYAPVAESVIKDIRFIVLTLGNQPLVKLKKFKSSLKNSGDQLETTHPLNVWRVIFSSNDTISAMHSIKRRRNVWKSFMSGMAESLQEASDGNNIKPEYVVDFAAKIGVDPNSIIPFIQQKDWSGFVKQLLESVPREGDPERYDQ